MKRWSLLRSRPKRKKFEKLPPTFRPSRNRNTFFTPFFRAFDYHAAMKTLILSDLHLGSKHSHTRQILEILERESFDRLILNGDTIHSLNLRKFKIGHWRVLDRLRSLVRSREVILLRGNHDHEEFNPEDGFGSRGVLPALLGVPMVEEYQLKVGDQSYLVLHGDRFDPILN